MAEKEKRPEKENGEVTEAATAVETAAGEKEELPKTIVRRLVKDKLSQLSTSSDVTVFREALQAFSESGRLFIHYLTATANEICKDSHRQIINAEDVFKALEDMDFPEFIQPLRDSLEEFRQKNAAKRSVSSKVKEVNGKGKRKEPPATEVQELQNGTQSEESEDDEMAE
ncbi:OLC1v1004618C1 [Oldenlandia corymbosa var. corymbosa]|uniref:OLC1v1004618C1 n=1 Tax=Oldenlandia corymbosa var. corymbosa TaxID=529605 RepID=A0AAV1DF65_OLDCO|nr:OLC1v1004618C1 [Oldenlandia corymbosa var. corymbosa]